MGILNKIQSSIIRFADDSPLIERYLICLDVVGISIQDYNNIDIPRIYIPITHDTDVESIENFYFESIGNPSIYKEGIENFRPGTEYYINETLQLLLGEDLDLDPMMVKPNYLIYDNVSKSYKISEYFTELDDFESNISDLTYFANKNSEDKAMFLDDDLDNLPQSFFKIILGEYIDNIGTTISDETKDIQPNPAYEAVMKYFVNYKNDAATRLLKVVFDTKIIDDTNIVKSYVCNSCTNTYQDISGSKDIADKTCLEKYQDAMIIWLQSMLSSIDYYNDWFMSSDTSDKKISNVEMINTLILLLESLLKYGNYPSTKTTKKYNCGCPSLDSSYDSSYDECSSNIIKNYIQVLKWVKDCRLFENKNKIGVYGKEFANLLIKY